MILMILVYILIWELCGILAAGLSIAYVDGKWGADRSDLGFAYLTGILFGPIALFVIFFISGFAEHGIKFKI